MGRRAHKPDPNLRRQVEAMAAYGIPEIDIGRVVGADPKTLRKHYRDELDMGETKANAQVAGYLFNSAKNGNVTAQIFWLKTRAKWRDAAVEVKHSGSIVRKDLVEYSDAELMAMITSSLDGFQRPALGNMGTPLKMDTPRAFLEFVAGDDYRPKE
jgi:hypothetical protein